MVQKLVSAAHTMHPFPCTHTHISVINSVSYVIDMLFINTHSPGENIIALLFSCYIGVGEKKPLPSCKGPSHYIIFTGFTEASC